MPLVPAVNPPLQVPSREASGLKRSLSSTPCTRRIDRAQGWRYEKDLHADTDIASEVVDIEKGVQGWTMEGQMIGGLDVRCRIALAAGVYETQLPRQLNGGMIGKDELFNPCQQESTRLQSQGFAPGSNNVTEPGLAARPKPKLDRAELRQMQLVPVSPIARLPLGILPRDKA